MKGIAPWALVLLAACAAPQPNIRATITPQAIAGATEPLLFVELPDSGAQAIMSLAGRNGGVVTWSTADGRSVSLQDGVLVATRGLGFDVMSADPAGTLAALAGEARQYERFASYLDGENRSVLRSFACEMAGPVTEVITSFGRRVEAQRWTETCTSLEGAVQAEFWVAGGEMWRAVQPVTGQVGAVLIERLTGE